MVVTHRGQGSALLWQGVCMHWVSSCACGYYVRCSLPHTGASCVHSMPLLACCSLADS